MTQPPLDGCPPGLEYLTAIDQLIIRQQIALHEGSLSFNDPIEKIFSKFVFLK